MRDKSTILLIEDSFLIREVIKAELSKLSKRIGVDFEVFSTDNGVEGTGYLYVNNNDLVIIDVTLPKYSGREIIDYLTTNSKFRSAKFIVLTEKIDSNLPSNFIQILKTSNEFLNRITEEVQNIFRSEDVKAKEFKPTLLARIITDLANWSDVIQHRIGKKSKILNKLLIPFWLILELIKSCFYVLYTVNTPKGKEAALIQRNKDLLAFRIRVYPAVALMLVSTIFLLAQTSLVVGTALGFLIGLRQPTHAASYTWDGGGTDGTCGGGVGDGNKWSCAANWSSDIVPLSTDTAVFDSTSTKNANIDTSFAGTITALTINTGYTGNITMQRTLTLSGAFTQSDGTFTASNQTLDMNSSFTLNTGAIFTASSGTTTLAGAFTINGGTFNHNSGIFTFDSTTAATLSCNSVTFNTARLSHTTGTKTINSNCTFPMGSGPTVTGPITLSGTLSGTGTISLRTITMQSGSALSGFTFISGTTNTDTFTFNGGSIGTPDFVSYTGHLTIASTLNASSFLSFNIDGNFTLNSGAVFTAPSSSMSVARAFTINAGSTFTHNGGTLVFDTSPVFANINISCNSTTFNLVSFTHTSNGTKTIASNCSFPLGNNPFTSSGGVSVLNGTFSGTGTISVSGSSFTLGATGTLSGFTAMTANNLNFVHSGGSMGTITSFVGDGSASATLTVSGTWNAGAFTTFETNNFIIQGSGNFTAPSGTMSVANTFTVNVGTTFSGNGGTLNFDGNSSSATFSCDGTETFNLITFTHTSGQRLLNSSCTFPIGNNPTITNSTSGGLLTGSGVLTVSNGTINSQFLSGFSGYNFTGSATVFNIDSALDASSASIFDINGSVTISAVSFTAPSLMSLGGGLSINSLATFTHNNGTIVFDGASGGFITCGSQTFNLIDFGHSAGTKIVHTDCSFPLGDNPSLGSNTASIELRGTFSGTGNMTHNGTGTLTLTSTGTISGFDGLVTPNFIHNGGTINTAASLVANGSITVAGTFNAGSYTTFDANSTFILNSPAIFTSPPFMTVESTFTINSGTTFTHNNGTVAFDGTTSATITCNSAVFNQASFTHTAGTKTINTNCTLPLGNNPTTSTGTITLNNSGVTAAAITGTGVLTVNGPFNLTPLGDISSFDEIIYNDTYTHTGGSYTNVSKLTLNTPLSLGVTFDTSNIAEIDLNDDFTLSNGAITAPALFKVSGDWTISGGTFDNNAGTVKLETAADRTFTGNTTFYNLSYDPVIDPTIYITSGDTLTITGLLSLKGQLGNLIYLSPTIPGSIWNIDPQGTYDIEYVQPSDSTNIGATVLNVAGTGSVNGGNNIGWNFGLPEISSLGPEDYINGSSHTDKTPTFTFNITDSDSGDTVGYKIQVDNTQDFSSPVIEFVSAFGAQGAFAFQVGQAANGGTYTFGSEGQQLSIGNYFWRVLGIDQLGNQSDYVVANSGNTAFTTRAVPQSPEQEPPADDVVIPPIVPEGPPITPPIKELPETDIVAYIQNLLKISVRDLYASLPLVLSTLLLTFSTLFTIGVPFFTSSLSLKDSAFRLVSIPTSLINTKKKSWGVVFDEIANREVPFAVIDLVDKNNLLIAQTTSDLKGKYGFLIDKKGEYVLEVRAEGFVESKTGINTDREVIQDIALQRVDKKTNFINRIFFYSKRRAISFLNITLTVVLLVGIVISLLAVLTEFSIFNIFLLSIYVVGVLLNITFLILRYEKESGKVLDNEAKKGIKGAIIRVYGKDRQIDILITNAEGKVKANLKKGEYLVTVSKDGYVQLQETAIVSVSERGFMDKVIYMKKQNNISKGPFA